MSADQRPENCRFRLQDEGKSYPRSSCTACGRTITTGLGRRCHYETNEIEALRARLAEAERECDRYASDAGERAGKLDAAEAEIERLKNELGDPEGVIAHANAITKMSEEAKARAEAAEAELAKAREALSGAAYIACMTSDTNSERGWFIVGWHGKGSFPNNEEQAQLYRRGMDARNALEPREPTEADKWCLHFTEPRAALAPAKTEGK